VKFLAYILLCLSLGSCIAVSIAWHHQLKDAKEAEAIEAKALGDLSDWQLADQLETRTIEAKHYNDLLDIQNDQLTHQIAALEGKSTASANAKLSADRAKLMIDDAYGRSHADLLALGPSEDERKEMEKAQRSHERKLSDEQWIPRFERMIYAAGALLLASGFAFALSARTKLQVQSTV
jgi:hypothetical protein